MDEKDFKKHLRDLAHGHHHPEEHDWATAKPVKKAAADAAKGGTQETEIDRHQL